MLSAIEKNKAVYWGGGLMMRREVAIICEVVTAGNVRRAQKKRGSELEHMGKSIQRVRTTKLQLRKLGLKEVPKLTVVTQLVQGQSWCPDTGGQLQSLHCQPQCEMPGPSLSIPPASGPSQ